jgi:hypothetical protein
LIEKVNRIFKISSFFLNLIQDTISLHTNNTCKLLEEHEHAFSMAYHLKDNVIKYNLTSLEKMKENGPLKHLSDEEFFEVCIYHELGHYLDYKRNPDRSSVRMKNDNPELEFLFIGEQNAWRYGKEILPLYRNDLSKHFDTLNESIIAYWKTNRMNKA